MTGQHLGHTTVRGNAGTRNMEAQALRPDDVTVAKVLQQTGYATAWVGKWGLGERESTGEPRKHGFDYYFGYLNQGHVRLMRRQKRMPICTSAPPPKRIVWSGRRISTV